jgi:deoxyribonuclease-4
MLVFNTFPYKLGSHIQFMGNIKETYKNAVKKGMYAFQFFLGNPKSYIRTKINEDDINESRLLENRFPCGVFSHTPYLYNLCGSVESLCWNGDSDIDYKINNIITSLTYELKILSNFKDNGVVIHPGCYKDRKKGLKTIAKTINKINFPENSKLLLENSAGQGNQLATTFLEIKEIINNIDKSKLKNIGVCIDTAHIYGYGEYDLSKKKEIDRMFNEFDEIIGLNYLKLIHLNDSQVEFGSKKDRHACIGQGYIWKEYPEVLLYFLERCENLNLHIVLETIQEDVFVINMLYNSLSQIKN